MANLLSLSSSSGAMPELAGSGRTSRSAKSSSQNPFAAWMDRGSRPAQPHSQADSGISANPKSEAQASSSVGSMRLSRLAEKAQQSPDISRQLQDKLQQLDNNADADVQDLLQMVSQLDGKQQQQLLQLMADGTDNQLASLLEKLAAGTQIGKEDKAQLEAWIQQLSQGQQLGQDQQQQLLAMLEQMAPSEAGTSAEGLSAEQWQQLLSLLEQQGGNAEGLLQKLQQGGDLSKQQLQQVMALLEQQSGNAEGLLQKLQQGNDFSKEKLQQVMALLEQQGGNTEGLLQKLQQGDDLSKQQLQQVMALLEQQGGNAEGLLQKLQQGDDFSKEQLQQVMALLEQQGGNAEGLLQKLQQGDDLSKQQLQQVMALLEQQGLGAPGANPGQVSDSAKLSQLLKQLQGETAWQPESWPQNPQEWQRLLQQTQQQTGKGSLQQVLQQLAEQLTQQHQGPNAQGSLSGSLTALQQLVKQYDPKAQVQGVTPGGAQAQSGILNKGSDIAALLAAAGGEGAQGGENSSWSQGLLKQMPQQQSTGVTGQGANSNSSSLEDFLHTLTRSAGQNAHQQGGGAAAQPPPLAANASASLPGQLRAPGTLNLPDTHIVDQTIEHLSLHARKDSQTIRIQLHPRELGQIKLELVWEADKLKAQLHTQTQQVQEVLERHLPRLKDALQQQGIDMEELEVAVEEQAREGFQENLEQQPWEQEQLNGHSSSAGLAQQDEVDPREEMTAEEAAAAIALGTSGLSLRI